MCGLKLTCGSRLHPQFKLVLVLNITKSWGRLDIDLTVNKLGVDCF